jgi:tetratricopeptide (TPR) repeat protein
MKWLLILLLFSMSFVLKAQDPAVLLKEADNFERQIKESEALDKYKQALISEPTNLRALVKAAELNATIGARLTDKNSKRLYFETAAGYAKKAFDVDPNNADANYVMGMAAGKMTDVESENKKIIAYVKDAKSYSEKAISINPKYAKAYYSIGKWHYEMVNLSGIKKMAVKLFYGGLPNGDLDSAITYFEKCKLLDPYFALNYLDLAKAYRDNHRPSQAIEVLNKLVKLPTRTGDDAAIKAEGAKMLNDIQ